MLSVMVAATVNNKFVTLQSSNKETKVAQMPHQDQLGDSNHYGSPVNPQLSLPCDPCACKGRLPRPVLTETVYSI
jgi:hypothetical protein